MTVAPIYVHGGFPVELLGRQLIRERVLARTNELLFAVHHNTGQMQAGKQKIRTKRGGMQPWC